MKHTNKLFILLLAVLLLGVLLSACTPDEPPVDGEHVHEGGEWSHNSSYHWQVCECGVYLSSTHEKHSGGTATYESGPICDVCGTEYGEHLHQYLDQWETDGKSHWKICSCGVVSDKDNHTGGTATYESGPICEVCGIEYGEHLHQYLDQWETDGKSHWKICSCGVVSDKDNHTGGTATHQSRPICEICGVEYGEHLHEFTGWNMGPANHWQVCIHCGKNTGYVAHYGGTATATKGPLCEACGYEYGTHTDHNFENIARDKDSHWKECYCGEKIEIAAHSGGTATYESGPTCEVCGYEYGEHIHNAVGWSSVGSNHIKRCSCNKNLEQGVHTGGTATTTSKATCEVCGEKYGELLPLDVSSLNVPGLMSGDTYMITDFACVIIPELRPFHTIELKIENIIGAAYTPLYWIHYLKENGYPETVKVVQSEPELIGYINKGNTLQAVPLLDVQYTAYDKDGNVIEFLDEDGKNPVGDRLKEMISTVYDTGTGNSYVEGISLRMDGSTSTVPLEVAFRMGYYGEPEDVATGKVKHNTTYGSFYNLMAGECDILFSALISDSQRQEAKNRNLDLAEVPICMEAFVFVVNANNPVEELTVQQLKDIYSGKITNWKEVGGSDAPIEAFQRNLTSGSQNYISIFMGDTPLMEPTTHITPASMEGLMDVLASYDNAINSIGYSVYSYAANMYVNSGKVKFIKVNGIAPTLETMGDLTYPLLNYNYAIYDKNNSNPEIEKMVDWILSDEGQQAVAEGGYVPLKGGNLPEYVDDNAIKFYESKGTGREASTKPKDGTSSTVKIPLSVEYPENYLEKRLYFEYYNNKYPIDFGKKYTIDGLVNEDLEKEINDFIEASVTEVESKFFEMYSHFIENNGIIHEFYVRDASVVEVTGKNGYLSVVVSTGYRSLANDSDYLNRYYTVAATYDLRSGKRVEKLSDLFPKDADFIEELNRELLYSLNIVDADFFATLYGITGDFTALTEDEAELFTHDSIIFPVNSRIARNGYVTPFYADSLATEYCDMKQFFTEDFKGEFSEEVDYVSLGGENHISIGSRGTAGVYYSSNATPALIKAAENLAEYIDSFLNEEALIKAYHDAGYTEVVEIECEYPVFVPRKIGDLFYYYEQIGASGYAMHYGIDANGNQIYSEEVSEVLNSIPELNRNFYFLQDTGKPVVVTLKDGWEAVATVRSLTNGHVWAYSELAERIKVKVEDVDCLSRSFSTRVWFGNRIHSVVVIIPKDYIILN